MKNRKMFEFPIYLPIKTFQFGTLIWKEHFKSYIIFKKIIKLNIGSILNKCWTFLEFLEGHVP